MAAPGDDVNESSKTRGFMTVSSSLQKEKNLLLKATFDYIDAVDSRRRSIDNLFNIRTTG